MRSAIDFFLSANLKLVFENTQLQKYLEISCLGSKRRTKIYMCSAPDGVGYVHEGVDTAIVHCLLPGGMNLDTILGRC